MKKKIFFVIKALLIVIISLILCIGIFSWNEQSVQGKALPMPFGVGVAEVISGSMSPTINVGDVIIVVKQGEYEVGDIVAFQDGNMVVTHRIVGVNPNGTFITKGDNPENSVDGDDLKQEYIFGKVVHYSSGWSGVIRFFKSPAVTISLLGIAVILFLLSIKKEKKDEKEENNEIEKIKREIANLKGDKTELSIEKIQAQIDALKGQGEEKAKTASDGDKNNNCAKGENNKKNNKGNTNKNKGNTNKKKKKNNKNGRKGKKKKRKKKKK